MFRALYPLGLLGLLGACDLRSERSAEQHLFDRVNRVRAQARSCGSATMDKAGPLRMDPRLAQAAALRAAEPQRTVTAAVRESGLEKFDALSESQVRGSKTFDTALDAWLADQAHCLNLMNDRFVRAGVGRHHDRWVLLMMAP
ncbi:uncharacterized protein YkwD [Deinobacterium chartae]|uniref:Uncharacterized protein YkwD n=1 Tax=Deinobacterium chartae TaxID=521158 RepID=A0A841I3L8_9DEIO|nr:CAP domain-containing protein [Deinobacterium chartae]MBB6099636.1 uncharacterized protein YkwD [Deinobacterium chartae]